MFVIGMSRRIARCAGPEATLVAGVGAVCGAHAANRIAPSTESREPGVEGVTRSSFRDRAGLSLLYNDMAPLFERLQQRLTRWIGSRLGVYNVRGFTVAVDNTRPDIATLDVLARLDEAVELIERYQPWRLRHLRGDLKQFRVMRFPCRGAYFAEYRACMVELTFLARRDIGPATVASTIIHEGMHARVHGMDVSDARDRAHEERICRRAELEFGLALPADIGAPVVERARASLDLADADVAPEIDWEEAMRRQTAVDRERA